MLDSTVAANKSENVLEVQNVSKKFRLYHEKRNSIFEQITSFFNKKQYYENLVVLDNVSFEVRRGEMFGIIGFNGSGKTTLLRLLANIMSPDKGKVFTNGKITPFLELGTGFEPELTAKDNIILYGMILGLTKRQIINKMKTIIEFSELEKFIDTKLKNFSTGMRARLAFSTAFQIDPDILLVDEVLSVGDLPFQEKCLDSFMSFLKKDKSIVFVSHDLETVRKLCDRVMFLYEGKIHSIGEPQKVVDEYIKFSKGKEI